MMTNIFSSSLTLPTSGRLENTPLPLLSWQQPMPLQTAPPAGLSEEETEGYTALGEVSILPYLEQTGYGRALQDLTHRTIVIENARLRATVLPDLGGRVHSLWDKCGERELLFSNPVMQFANLSLRNAWFSGGIEWNAGSIPGHSPATCEPVFAHLVETERGPLLRLHEFDRVSETAWQVDLFLPEDGAALYVHGRIFNPNETNRQVYWWTNATAAHTEGQRIMSPADYVIEHVLPDNHLEPFSYPERMGFDASYPANWQNATSVFFRKPGQERPWIAAINSDGTGIAQVSTRELRGRKYFYFGEGQGGQHWMNFLSPGQSGAYVEIQSGLMPTQNQRMALGPRESVSWTECFLPVSGITDIGGDYPLAKAAAQAAVDHGVPADLLEDIHGFLGRASEIAPGQRLNQGSDWGALQEALIGRRIAAGLDFGDPSVRATPWHELALSGNLSTCSAVPESFVVSDIWRAALTSARIDAGAEWLRDLTLGLMYLDEGGPGDAIRLLESSVAHRDTWLGRRLLAVAYLRISRISEALATYERAIERPDAPSELVLEYINSLIDADRISRAEELIAEFGDGPDLPERFRLAAARIALKTGNTDRLDELLDYDFATIREGETILTTLWQGLVTAKVVRGSDGRLDKGAIVRALAENPVPKRLNFELISHPVPG